ncbi:MAG: recombinase family protein [Pseudomonadota bacterium]
MAKALQRNESTARRVGYARVSTDKQTLYQYTDALTEAGCDDIFTDAATSAVADERPGLQAARAALLPGDTFVVLAIDRAFRSTIEGLIFLDGLHKEGIHFLSIYQQMDTRTPEGRKRFTYDVADAEYERAIISRRTKDKMAAARRRGQHLGRPHKLKRRSVFKAYDLITNDGIDLGRVAKRYRVAPVTIRRAFERYGLAAEA